jgi:hypothetical protein
VEQLFHRLLAAATQLLPQLISQGVANLLYAQASCGRFSDPQIFQQLARAMQAKLAVANLQDICVAA